MDRKDVNNETGETVIWNEVGASQVVQVTEVVLKVPAAFNC